MALPVCVLFSSTALTEDVRTFKNYFRGRVQHGRHFTFKSVLGDTAITFVAPNVTGTFVSSDNPFVANGPWLQVLVSEDLAQQMSESFELLHNDVSRCILNFLSLSFVIFEMMFESKFLLQFQISLPKIFMWKEYKLAITIVPD